MPRQSTGKRTRFEVFDRDHFTCQYCGAQPPAVVLVIDHITAVASGGGNSPDNLITACEPCNQGKATRTLGTAPVRPDADLLYLATQQEIAEMQRYQAALVAREQAMNGLIGTLQDLWCDVGQLDWCPPDKIIRQLINLRGVEVTAAAIEDVAPKVATKYVQKYRYIPYLFAVAKTFAINAGDIPAEEAG